MGLWGIVMFGIEVLCDYFVFLLVEGILVFIVIVFGFGIYVFNLYDVY